MTRRLRRILGGSALAVALVLAGCGDDDPGAEETTTPSTEAVITAPPTKTPEEESEEEIIATFERLIADMDEYYANASDYTAEEISTSPPTVDWPIVQAAELEVSNWLFTWRTDEVESMGATIVASHGVTSIGLNISDAGVGEAASQACLDMTNLTYQTYDGNSADLSYEPTQYQTWRMTWIYEPDAAPESGIEEPGWYMQTIDLTLDEPC